MISFIVIFLLFGIRSWELHGFGHALALTLILWGMWQLVTGALGLVMAALGWSGYGIWQGLRRLFRRA